MGTRQNRLDEAVLTSTHNLCFEQKYEQYQNFLSENFQFLVVKFSVYLDRRVFVMFHCPHKEMFYPRLSNERSSEDSDQPAHPRSLI